MAKPPIEQKRMRNYFFLGLSFFRKCDGTLSLKFVEPSCSFSSDRNENSDLHTRYC